MFGRWKKDIYDICRLVKWSLTKSTKKESDIVDKVINSPEYKEAYQEEYRKYKLELMDDGYEDFEIEQLLEAQKYVIDVRTRIRFYDFHDLEYKDDRLYDSEYRSYLTYKMLELCIFAWLIISGIMFGLNSIQTLFSK